MIRDKVAALVREMGAAARELHLSANRLWELRNAEHSPVALHLSRTPRERYFDALLLACTERALRDPRAP